MIVYVDASVLLRVVLGESGALESWGQITRRVSSEIIRLECLRTIDRARVRRGLSDEVVAERRAAVLQRLGAFELVPLDAVVLARAADPFPTVLGSFDAVHLARALLARPQLPELLLATHDRALAVGAHAMGFRVLGASVP